MYTHQRGSLSWLWVQNCGPRPIYIHELRKVQKHSTLSYTDHSENCTYSNIIFHILPIHLFVFSKKGINGYTFEEKKIPFRVMDGLQSIPHSSRKSVYTFMMKVYPPPPPPLHAYNKIFYYCIQFLRIMSCWVPSKYRRKKTAAVAVIIYPFNLFIKIIY